MSAFAVRNIRYVRVVAGGSYLPVDQPERRLSQCRECKGGAAGSPDSGSDRATA